MVRFILRALFTAAVALGLSYVLPGIHIHDYWSAIILIFVLGILNAVIRPLLVLLTLPATILTFGLFLLVINAVIILIGNEILGDRRFKVDGFWAALLFSLILSLINSFLDRKERQENLRG